jgi:hypothetical protein
LDEEDVCDSGDDDDDEDMLCDDDATSPGVRAPFIADSSTGAWKSKNSALCTREVLASSGVIFVSFAVSFLFPHVICRVVL